MLRRRLRLPLISLALSSRFSLFAGPSVSMRQMMQYVWLAWPSVPVTRRLSLKVKVRRN